MKVLSYLKYVHRFMCKLYVENRVIYVQEFNEKKIKKTIVPVHNKKIFIVKLLISYAIIIVNIILSNFFKQCWLFF